MLLYMDFHDREKKEEQEVQQEVQERTSILKFGGAEHSNLEI